MEDSVRYSCDASFDHPSALVFNGLLYHKTITPINALPDVNFARVKPCGQYQEDGDMEVEDAWTDSGLDFLDENGPEFVVFNRFVYVRSDEAEAIIDDGILRTVAVKTLFDPMQSVVMTAMGYAYEHPVAQASVPVGPQQFNNPVPRQPRVMPQRATVKQLSALEPLFDLELEERVGVTYIVPSHNNVIAPTTPGMIPNPRPGGRTHWKGEHVKYLDELMELAMLQMNRPLLPKDFKAITEALHRHFRANGGIAERGYNTVHSHATRRRAYSSLVQRVLPDIGFPDYVRFKPRTPPQEISE